MQDINRRLNPGQARETLSRPADSSPKRAPGSPQKNKNTEEAPDSPSRQRYLPSRIGANEHLHNPMNKTRSVFLNNLQSQMVAADDEIARLPPEKGATRLKELKNQPVGESRSPKMGELKKKPIKKSESDFLLFREIFVDPKEKVLSTLKDKEKAFSNLIHKGATEQYDKILGVYKDDDKKNIKGTENPKTQRGKEKLITSSGSTTRIDFGKSLATTNKFFGESMESSKIAPKTNNPEMLKTGFAKEADDDLEVTIVPKGKKQKVLEERIFFEQQIQVQPPDTPNYNSASPLTPGNGWAPSVPLIKKIDTSKTNVKDLIVRAKAGMQVGDAQKEAHLSFYIGMVHETKKEFKEAVKAYRRFMICAQNMEDKVGVALAMNRIGINYFNIGKYDKSEEFHKKNLELTDKENSFAGFYNLGITYRSMKRLIESLENFKIALEWAREYKVAVSTFFYEKDVESECLALGQMGLTYFDLYELESAFEFFDGCLGIASKLGNLKLQLDCLLNLSKISKLKGTEDEEYEERALGIFDDAYNTAKQINDNKVANKCLCSIGVMGGIKQFNNFTREFDFQGYE